MVKTDPVKALKAALTDKLHIDTASNPLYVRMDGESIVIDGMVERISQKKRALYIAMGLAGPSGVVDRLKVRPSAHMTDEEIKEHMEDAIDGESALQLSKINIEVRDGVMDIEGTVGSLSHKRLAGVLAWWIPGSKDVINSLEVVPPEDDTDDEIADALRMVLDKDRLVDAPSVSISVKDWIVTLGGVACNDTEKEAAEDDAWYIWGVNEVVNNMTVRAGAHPIP